MPDLSFRRAEARILGIKSARPNPPGFFVYKVVMANGGYQGLGRGERIGCIVALATFFLVGLPATGIAAALDGGVCEGVPQPCHSPSSLTLTVFVSAVVICILLWWLVKVGVNRSSGD
jgi:hypothetical protein